MVLLLLLLLLLPHNSKIGWDLKFNTSTMWIGFYRIRLGAYALFLFASFLPHIFDTTHGRDTTIPYRMCTMWGNMFLFHIILCVGGMRRLELELGLGPRERDGNHSMMLMWYVNSGMLTYDENEMPKIVPFDFITPNYLQNVVSCAW